VQYELQIFEYQDNNAFRVVDIDGEPWFVLADVCRQLDLKSKNGSVSHHADRLDDDERRTVPASVLREASSLPEREGARPITRTMLVVNESGLYSLILRSDKPQAKKFKKWITSEVLPSIRRTGGYAGAGAVPAFIRRFNHNWDRIEVGPFSVLSELVVRLWGRLEQVGCRMKDQSATGIELRPMLALGCGFRSGSKNSIPLSRPNIRNTCTGRRRAISRRGSTPTKCGRSLSSTLIRFGCRNADLNTSKHATPWRFLICRSYCRRPRKWPLRSGDQTRPNRRVFCECPKSKCRVS
jgi:prophage antirepressor-like protein